MADSLDWDTANDLLWTSGGKLELPKCGYHTVYYTFKPDGTPILHHKKLSSDSGEANPEPFTFDYDTTEITRQHQITIRSASGTPISITAKDVNTPRNWVILNRHQGAQRSRQLKFLSKLQI